MNFADANAQKGIMIINGETVDLFNLQPSQIPMDKLVQGLQGVIRFNGYSGLSVAQHSLFLSLVTENVAKLALATLVERSASESFNAETDLLCRLLRDTGLNFDRIQGLNRHQPAYREQIVAKLVDYFSAKMAYEALIHDFSEALTGDIIRPFKTLVPEIREMENRIDSQIRQAHGAMEQMPLLVDVLDKQLASIEAYFLTRFDGKTIIDDTEQFQVNAFNSAFIAQDNLGVVVSDLIGLEQDFSEPLTNKNLYKFMEYSGTTIADVQAIGKGKFLFDFIGRAIALQNRIERYNDKEFYFLK